MFSNICGIQSTQRKGRSSEGTIITLKRKIRPMSIAMYILQLNLNKDALISWELAWLAIISMLRDFQEYIKL
jgi:hypothetical protein